MTDPIAPDHENNLVAAGGVLVLLMSVESDTVDSITVVVDADGNPTNRIDIGLSFMSSPYRLTVERVRDEDGAP